MTSLKTLWKRLYDRPSQGVPDLISLVLFILLTPVSLLGDLVQKVGNALQKLKMR